MITPKVSVCVITYNHAEFIRQALDSALMQQARFPFEIVVGEDCSTDGTREIVEAFAKANPGRVIPVLPERNLGDGGRRLFLETLRHCRGEYIAVLEGDDFWTSANKLERQADYLDGRPECSLCFHNAIVVAEDGAQGENFIPPGHPETISTGHIVRWFCIPTCSAMMRRGVIERLPKWFEGGPFGDLPMFLAAAELGPLGYIDEPWGAYRVHSGGTWSRLSAIARLRSFIAALDALAAPLGPARARMLADARSMHHINLARELASTGRVREAARHVAIAVRLDPTLKLSLKLALRYLAGPAIRAARSLFQRRRSSPRGGQ